MLALNCLYSGGVSGWAGGWDTLYWRVETTVTGAERGGREREADRGRGDADGRKEGKGPQTKENRKEKNVRIMKSN